MTLRSLLLCTFLMAASAGPALAAPTVPLAAFVYEDQFSHPRLAPDGKHIAITARVPDGDRFVPIVTFYSVPEMQMTGAIRVNGMARSRSTASRHSCTCFLTSSDSRCRPSGTQGRSRPATRVAA